MDSKYVKIITLRWLEAEILYYRSWNIVLLKYYIIDEMVMKRKNEKMLLFSWYESDKLDNQTLESEKGVRFCQIGYLFIILKDTATKPHWIGAYIRNFVV